MIVEKKNYLYLFSFLFLILSWKYPIKGFYGTGVRFDDFIILFGFLYFILTQRFKLLLPDFVTVMVVFTITSLLSSIISFSYGTGVSPFKSILFSLRHVEYLMVFYIGINLRSAHVISALKFFVIYQFVIVILQSYGYLSFGTLFNVEQRQVGSTGGPWELAVIMAMPLFYFLSKRMFFYSGLSAFVLLSTGSRVTIVAVLLVFLLVLVKYIFLAKNMNKKIITALLFIVFISISVAFVVFGDVYFIERLVSLRGFEYVHFDEMYLANEISPSQFKNYDIEYIKSVLSTVSSDASAYSRFSRWSLAIETLKSYSVIFFLTGLGPSFFGNALDGSFLRILLTTGLLGFSLYIIFLYKIYQFILISRSWYLMGYLFVYVFSCLFIDISFSLKATLFLWLFLGVVYGERLKNV